MLGINRGAFPQSVDASTTGPILPAFIGGNDADQRLLQRDQPPKLDHSSAPRLQPPAVNAHAARAE